MDVLTRRPSRLIYACVLVLGLSILPSTAFGRDRDEVMACARDYAELEWYCGPENLVVDCSSDWESDYEVGDYVGVPYDWGGWVSTARFLADLEEGKGAGSHSWHGILECTTGVDCSGFVSQCWQCGRQTTGTLSSVADEIGPDELLPGDVWNDADSHVVIHSGWLEDGRPTFYEASGGASKVVHTTDADWSYLDGYTPLRYLWIEGSGDPDNPYPIEGEGTIGNPYLISGFPFQHYGNTAESPSSEFDYYNCAPDTPEPGPEVFYRLDLSEDGDLTLEVEDAFGIDVDLHLLSAPDAASCLGRHDRRLTLRLEAGRYYIVADTWSGDEYAGPYRLSVDFVPAIPDTDGDQGPHVDDDGSGQGQADGDGEAPDSQAAADGGDAPGGDGTEAENGAGTINDLGDGGCRSLGGGWPWGFCLALLILTTIALRAHLYLKGGRSGTRSGRPVSSRARLRRHSGSRSAPGLQRAAARPHSGGQSR